MKINDATVARWENIYNYKIDIIEDNDISHVVLLNSDKHPYGIVSI